MRNPRPPKFMPTSQIKHAYNKSMKYEGQKKLKNSYDSSEDSLKLREDKMLLIVFKDVFIFDFFFEKSL